MAGAKGYRSYRGKGTKRKVLLAILLCLVIVAAVAVIWVQEHIVYDADGTARLDIPWADRDTEEPQEELDLVIQEPEGPAPLRILSLEEGPLTQAALESLRAAAGTGTYNAYAVTLKSGEGAVYFESRTALADAVETAEDTAAALASLTGTEGITPVARISCLLDPEAGRADVEGMGLMNTGGYIFYDGNNLNWLDPSKENTQAYLSGFAVEAAELGFREILLTDFHFPTEGSLDKIAYPEEGLRESLRACLEAVRTALDEAGYEEVSLSVETTAEVIVGGQSESSGQALADIAALADRVYAPASEDQAEALAAAAEAAGLCFVPELETAPAAPAEGSYLLTLS